MNKKNIAAFTGLGFVTLTSIGQQSAAQEVTGRTLNQVVVTASRSPRKQSDIGKVVRIIDSAQLAQSQGRTLPEVLNNVAGLTLSGTGNAPGSPITVFTRGAARGNTLILIDGIPANNAADINNDYDISSIAIDQIERIEILRGANSTLYGSDAVAGVINIITKKPLQGKLNGDVLVTGGSYKTYKQAVGVNGTIGKTGIALNASNLNSNGFSAAKDQAGAGGFDKDGFDQKSFSGHITQQLSENFSMGANVQLNENKFDLDGGAFVDDKDFTGKNKSFFGGLNAKYVLPNGAINLIFNENNVLNIFDNPDGKYFAKTRNKGKINYFEQIYNGKLFPFLDIVSGMNYRKSKTDQAYESLSAYGPYNSYLNAANSNTSIFSVYTSLFLKVQDFHLELGGRYNNHSLYGDNYTYTINPSYVIANNYKVFASVGSAFKAPSLYQLTSAYKNVNGLEPQTTYSYEAGVDLNIVPSKVNLTATVFKRNSKQLIYFYSDPKTFASEYRNGAKQNDKGFEVELNTNPLTNLTLNTWYAFVKGKGFDYTGKETTYLFRRPKNTFGATSSYQINSIASVSVIYKYTGNTLDPYFNNATFKTESIEQKNHHNFDVYAQVKPITNLVFFADVKNLFDRNYTEWEGYNTKGRNFNAGLKYNIR